MAISKFFKPNDKKYLFNFNAKFKVSNEPRHAAVDTNFAFIGLKRRKKAVYIAWHEL